MKINESMRGKYLDLSRKLKKKNLWNVNVTLIIIVASALGTVPKCW